MVRRREMDDGAIAFDATDMQEHRVATLILEPGVSEALAVAHLEELVDEHEAIAAGRLPRGVLLFRHSHVPDVPEAASPGPREERPPAHG